MVASSNCTPLADIDFNNDELVEVGEILNILKAYIANLVEEKAISKSTFDNEIRELSKLFYAFSRGCYQHSRERKTRMLNHAQLLIIESA